MGRKPKPKTSTTATTDSPLHPLLLPRDDTADDMLTWLMLAAEELAARRDGLDRSLRIEHATPAYPTASPPDPFYRLPDLASDIKTTVEADTLLFQMLDRIPETFTSAWGIQTLFRSLFSRARPSGRLPGNRPGLTERELEVLRELSRGETHAKISRTLGIAQRTVDRHIANIYAKLGVNQPKNAIARATALGMLDIDPLHILRLISGSEDRSARTVDTFFKGAVALDRDPDLADLKRLASFGLLLMALCGAMARQLSGDIPQRVASRGLVMELDRHGSLKRAFGSDRLGTAHNVVQAPEHAAAAGFTPGNLFVAHDLVPQRGLSRAAISEYTSAGDYVRTFSGGRHLATRLVGPLTVAFAADGRLLATSGWLTDGILAFSDGGQSVNRFADGLFWQIAVDPKGQVYGVQHSDLNGAVRAFDAEGRDIGLLTNGKSHNLYQSITVSPSGRLFVCLLQTQHRLDQSFILTLEADGRHLHQFDVPGYRWSLLACDAESCLYVPCDADDTLKVVREDGAVLQSFPLGGRIMPRHTAIGADGRLWVCGRAL